MPASSLPLHRKILFSAILTTVLCAFIAGVLELGLRLAGFGHSSHFIRQERLSDGTKVWRENRWCTAPFFSEKLVRRPQSLRLSQKKSSDTIRIFVLGSSAAMGDPEASFSLARMLETLLTAAYPGKKFEVINAAVTAINSHLVRGIAEDCSQLEPDIFVVYEGNNEVIGPFGPAGVFTSFLHNETALRAAIHLKGTRTGQLFSSFSQRNMPANWAGMEMFLKQQIRASDPRLNAVRDHFRANLLSIANSAQNAAAATFVCTVLTNQRDFAPFLSLHSHELDASSRARWQEYFDAAEAATRSGDFTSAETAYRSALAIDDEYAELHFRLGRLMLQTNRDSEARGELQRALDLDTLRFRTDSTLNQIIRGLPAEPKDRPGLHVVDLASSLAARSAHGVIGDDLLYEHVHLTFRGTYEAACELLGPITANLTARGKLPAGVPTAISIEEARLRLAFTAHEQAMIFLTLEDRFRHAPFTEQSDRNIRLETISRRIAAANATLNREDALPALRAAYAKAIEFSPDDWVLARNAGMMFVARNSPAEALPLLEKAVAWIDDDTDTLIALARTHRALGHAEETEKYFSKARRLEPTHPELH